MTKRVVAVPCHQPVSSDGPWESRFCLLPWAQLDSPRCMGKVMAELAESREAYLEEGDDDNIHEVRWPRSSGSCGATLISLNPS